MRKILRRVHLLLALGVGLFIALSGLTGSILVFRPELDRALNGDLLAVVPRDAPQRLDDAIAAVRARFPDEPIRFVRLARTEDESYEFWIGASPLQRVYVDPYDARILGWRGEHDGLIGFITDLHEHLLSAEIGTTANGVAAIATLMLLLTGLVLWWPGLSRLADTFRIRRNVPPIKWTYDVHRLVGIVSFPLLFLSALTGAALVFHHVAAALLIAALGGPSLPAPPKLAKASRGPAMATADLVARAQAALPEAIPTWIMWPTSSTAPFLVRFRFPENPHRNGTSYLAIDPADGAILSTHSYRAAGPGQRAADLRYPLHTGDAFGLAGRIAASATGLAPVVLLATGFAFWLLRHRPGKSRRTKTMRAG